MKNKSKKDKIANDKLKNSKIKNNKKEKQSVVQIPTQWFYMTPQEVDVRTIQSSLEDEKDLSIQVWVEADVLELEFETFKSIEFEKTKVDLKDEYSNAFLEEHQIKTLFYVDIDPANFKRTEQIFKKITTTIGGFFCGDTDDFTPVIGGRS